MSKGKKLKMSPQKNSEMSLCAKTTKTDEKEKSLDKKFLLDNFKQLNRICEMKYVHEIHLVVSLSKL
jgi:hypothetical protein